MSAPAKSHAGLVVHRPGTPLARRNETSVFGFWVFMMSDLVLFALIFATFAVMSRSYADGPRPEDFLELRGPFLGTMALLLSSMTYGFVSIELKHGRRRRHVAAWLIVTALLGAGFLYLEGDEFVRLAGEGVVPQKSAYLSAYFVLVGTHGLHVLGGVVWALVMLLQLALWGVDDLVSSRLVRLGIYWHLLDIVWIGIFSVVYLPGVM